MGLGKLNCKNLSRSTSPEMLKFSTSHRSFRCKCIAVDELDDFEHIGDGSMSKVSELRCMGKMCSQDPANISNSSD